MLEDVLRRPARNYSFRRVIALPICENIPGMCTEYDPLRGADFLFFKSHGAERSGYPYVCEITDFDGADFRE